jgi:hypothetical protein
MGKPKKARVYEAASDDELIIEDAILYIYRVSVSISTINQGKA